MNKYILILNGPNLNLLGKREPEIYGTKTLDDVVSLVEKTIEEKHPAYPVEAQHFQSNHEGELIDAIHRAGFDPDCLGIILNAGAYTHTSVAIADAIAAVPAPVIEVHISNIAAREAFRHTSLIAPVCAGSIAGFGIFSYALAASCLLAG